jgi:CRISPR/Cas system CMR-associated protein Cmr5 small subunit
MADNILRLRVDSQEYDAKLKKAAEGIRHLAEVAHTGGGELTGLEKAELDYIKSLGTMETKSRTAAGSVRELENTFKELTVVYNQLNDVEKQDEGGKALAASLDQLKQRAQAARAELDNASKALGEQKDAGQQTGGMLEGLAGKFGLSITKVMGFGTALSAGKVALDVAKDAFMSSETNVDDWGRTVRSAEGIYQSFVQSLNTGDFTGFLSNIGRVTQAAQEAYNALDELGTRMTIINPERARLQARQQELRADIRRNGADSEVGKAALAELKKIEPLLSKSFKTESQMNYTAFEKLVRERLAEGGINLNQKSFQQFMKTFSSDTAFQNLRKNARGSVTTEMTGNAYNPNAAMTRRTVDTRNIEQKLLDLFTDEWRQANSGYLTASFSAQGAAASNALGNARYMRAGSGGGNGGKSGTTDSEKELTIQQQIAKLEEEAYTATDERRTAIAKQVQELDQELERQKAIRDQVHGIVKETKAQPVGMTFTAAQLEGMSFDNQMPTIRGNNGRAQDKLDLATAAFATGGISNIDFSTYISGIKNALSNANLGDELYNNMTEKLKDATTVSTLLQEMMERGLAGADLETTAQALKEKLLSPEGIDQTAIQSFLEELNKQIEEAGGVGLKLNADTGEVTDDKGKGNDDGEDPKKFNEGIGKLTGGLSQVTGGLKAVGVEIPKEVDQVIGVINGVSQIISGVGTIISIFGTTAITANTTAVGLNTAAIGGLIAALEFNSATNFFGLANGGIVPAFAQGGLIGRAAGGMMIPGNSMSGDRLRLPVDGGRGMIGVNSGELILNRAQQGNLAAQLEGGSGLGNLKLEARVDTEEIVFSINQLLGRTSNSEMAKSRN